MKNKYIILLVCFLLLSVKYTVSQNKKLDSLLNQLNHLPNDTNKVNLLHDIVLGYYHLSEFDSAAVYAGKRLDLSEKLNDPKGKQLSHFQYAYIYYRKSFYETAIYHANKSLEICRSRKDRRFEAESLNILGITYKNTGDYDRSLKLFFEALKIWEALDKKEKQVIVLNNIGLSYYYMEKYETALEYYLRCYDICQEIDYTNGKSLYYSNCGLLFYKQKEYDKALDYYERSLQIELQQNDQYGIPICYTNIGDIYKQQKLYNKAFEYYNKGLLIREKYLDVFGVANSYLSIGELHYLQKDYKKSNDYLKKCIAKSKEINALNITKEVYSLLSENYYHQKDYLNAYENQKLYKQAYDSIFSIENNKQILELQTKYEAEKKEAENRILIETQRKDREVIARKKAEIKSQYLIISCIIIILSFVFVFAYYLYRANKRKGRTNYKLSRQNIEIRKQKAKIEVQQSLLKDSEELLKKQNVELQNSNATKDRFFSIIAHDLRAPFNSLLCFIGLLSEKEYDENNQEEKEEFIGMLDATVKNTYKLLENLLLWSRSQRGAIDYNPETINLYQLSDGVIQMLSSNANLKSIKMSNQISDDILIDADINIFTTILRNLISNAIKFTPKGGEIVIGNKTKTNTDRVKYIEIFVIDNGIGISEETLRDLFKIDKNTSQRGTEDEAGSGLGLVLCKELIELHNGKIEVESQLQKGSKFTLSLPVKNSLN